MRAILHVGNLLLTLASIFKLVAEIALLAMIGQWVLGLLAGAKRAQNVFYQVLEVLTRPIVRGVRLITPRVVIDRHLPVVAFLLMLIVWICATAAKISICVEMGVHLCK